MNKTITLLLIVLLIVAACGTKSGTGQLNTAGNSDPIIDAQEKSVQQEKIENKSLTLPLAASTSTPTEIEATAQPPAIIDVETPSVPDVDLISVSQAGDNMTTVEAVRALGPSVVQISTDTVAISLYNRIVPQTGVGSGIIIDKVGNILTNNHVVEGADLVTVTLNDGRSYPATLVGSDNITDLAVIKISAAKLTPAKFGISAELQVGEDVIAVGHALGSVSYTHLTLPTILLV
mgnify:FL=1